MDTTAAQIGTTDWNLTGIRSTGGVCGHCDRNLKHVFTVKNQVTGAEMTVGRACCKKVTGWTLSAAEAVRILKAAENRAKRESAWDKFSTDHPELAAPIDAAMQSENKRTREQAHGFRFEICESRYADVQVRWARQYAELAI